MSVRLNITIPDKLHERLQKVKDNLNVSKICTERIKQAVKIEEMKLVENPDFDQFADRIKEEMKLDAENERESGYQDGLKDAIKLEYPQFKSFMAEYFEMKSEEDGRIEYNFDIVHELFYDYAPENRVHRMERQASIGYVYERGWIEAVADTYNKVIKQILPKDEDSVDDN